MTDDELRAAVQKAADVVRDNPSSRECPTKWPDYVLEACATLAHQYLREHPPDDGTDIDDVWLRAAGFHRITSGRPRWETGDARGPRVWRMDYPEEARLLWGYDAGPFQGSVPFEDAEIDTRGDVRRLCAALGVPLTAGGRGEP